MSRDLRWFIDGEEVTSQQALDAERCGAARVMRGGSGVVPERLRRSGETVDQYLNPWVEMETFELSPPSEYDHAPAVTP